MNDSISDTGIEIIEETYKEKNGLLTLDQVSLKKGGPDLKGEGSSKDK